MAKAVQLSQLHVLLESAHPDKPLALLSGGWGAEYSTAVPFTVGPLGFEYIVTE